jgi:hypothetical protein
MALKGETVQPRGMYQRSCSNGVGMIIAPPKLSLILIWLRIPTLWYYTRMSTRGEHIIWRK